MRIILARHGETEENVAGIMQGHLPGKLTEKGKSQARRLALDLKDERIDYIYSSDLRRAADTAKEIARYHKDTPIEFTSELRERNLGEFQGKRKSDYGWDKKEVNIEYPEPEHGETREQGFKRASTFLGMILSKHKSGTVLIVGHSWMNRAIITAIKKKPHTSMHELSDLENASVFSIEI